MYREEDLINFNNNQHENIFIIGVGLIGGSIALAIKQSAIDRITITGFDIDNESIQYAIEKGIIDQSVKDIKEGVKNADLVIICTPVEVFREVISKIALSQKRDVIITDTCSLKSEVVRDAISILPYPENFIGGHPMAGSEKGGVRAASPHLFKNRVYFLTPDEKTGAAALRSATWLVNVLGARMIAINPEEHDQLVAFNSHLPHIIAWVLMKSVVDKAGGYKEVAAAFSGGSFRDATRVALSNPELWKHILLKNKQNLVKAINVLMSELKSFTEALDKGDINVLSNFIEEARSARFKLTEPEGLKPEEMFEMSIIIENQPGELARVTTILGKAQVNIENLEIVHGEGQGTLIVTVRGKETLKRGKEALKKNGYEVLTEVEE